MLSILFGSNGTILRSIVSKYITKLFKDNGLKSNTKVNDFVMYKEHNEITVHISMDLKMKEQDLLNFLNGKLDATE